MKIKSLMISDPITITEDASIEEAISLMKANSIRHLPVVSENKTLQGLVTLADLKLGLIPSMLGTISLSDLIVRKPVTIGPDDDVEDAARLIYKHKIGGMPVVKKQKVVGIITDTDILRTFIDMMGLLTASSRIDVVVGDKASAFKKALHIIQDTGGEIINIGMTAPSGGKKTYYFRLSPCSTEAIKKALESEGFDVSEAMD